jgi:hypothetical protein
MAETKSFDPAVIATLSTGTLLVAPFGLAHEAAEWIMGHSVWTHQFPTLLPKMREAVLAQFPDMPVDCAEGQHEAVRDAVRARYGEAVEVARGGGETAIAPLDPKGFPGGLHGDAFPIAIVEA